MMKVRLPNRRRNPAAYPNPAVAFHKRLEAGVLEQRHAQEVVGVGKLIADVERSVAVDAVVGHHDGGVKPANGLETCLLYTSDAADD